MLLDGITDSAVVMLDGGGIVRSWNEGARRLHGHATEAIVGEHVPALDPAENGNRAATVTAQLEMARTRAAAPNRLTGGAP